MSDVIDEESHTVLQRVEHVWYCSLFVYVGALVAQVTKYACWFHRFFVSECLAVRGLQGLDRRAAFHEMRVL
jgi:hypothetical protein